MRKTSDDYPMVPCQKCVGEGYVPLSDDLFKTLGVLKRLKRATAPQIHAVMDKDKRFHVTAFNNRLEDLKDLGLATRTRLSRTWVYEPTPTKGAK